MFDSPFDFCPRCEQMVLLDQTLKECVREHQCDEVTLCPLGNYFSGHDFSAPKSSKQHQALHHV
jgi:hypothetical protein